VPRRPWRSSRRRSRDTPLIFGTHHSAGTDRPALGSLQIPGAPAGFPESCRGYSAPLQITAISRPGGGEGSIRFAEKAELWDRWKRGESLKAIGRAFGKQSSSIYFLVASQVGFVLPCGVAQGRALTLWEREVISTEKADCHRSRSYYCLRSRSCSTGKTMWAHYD
jgi:hypothetical protein